MHRVVQMDCILEDLFTDGIIKTDKDGTNLAGVKF